MSDLAGILDIWRDVFPHTSEEDPASLADVDLFDSGADSLSLLSLATEISAIYGVELDIVDLTDAATPRGIAELLDDRRRAGPTVQSL